MINVPQLNPGIGGRMRVRFTVPAGTPYLAPLDWARMRFTIYERHSVFTKFVCVALQWIAHDGPTRDAVEATFVNPDHPRWSHLAPAFTAANDANHTR